MYAIVSLLYVRIVKNKTQFSVWFHSFMKINRKYNKYLNFKWELYYLIRLKRELFLFVVCVCVCVCVCELYYCKRNKERERLSEKNNYSINSHKIYNFALLALLLIWCSGCAMRRRLKTIHTFSSKVKVSFNKNIQSLLLLLSFSAFHSQFHFINCFRSTI